MCESCIENHKCVEEEGEDVLLPVVNSPRVGECAYAGHEDKYVKKFFPKEIFEDVENRYATSPNLHRRKVGQILEN
ncbi:hypothetical protein LEP1GSC060_3255 [Leptospira weilii serovar Ranarum str. ICFT]|uniref:Uncharacterized protein n=1 Tax=Leptospira weilii serovar Ranarum str. ICFT TaxID=1218598 RepID=N1W8Z8_9LEPT|nr:hypothetical protein LEP1GSC060_3255 [Leptospira weilii serovar Ranarum str. ICFT]